MDSVGCICWIDAECVVVVICSGVYCLDLGCEDCAACDGASTGCACCAGCE